MEASGASESEAPIGHFLSLARLWAFASRSLARLLHCRCLYPQGWRRRRQNEPSLFADILECTGQVLRKAEVVVCLCRSNALEKSRVKHVAMAEMCCPKQGLAKEEEGAEVRASLPEVSHQALSPTVAMHTFFLLRHQPTTLPAKSNTQETIGPHQIITSTGTSVEAAAVLGRGGNVLIPIGADQVQRWFKTVK